MEKSLEGVEFTELSKSRQIRKNVFRYFLGGKKDVHGILKQPIPKPLPKPFANNHLQFEGYWVTVGNLSAETPCDYILTPSVRKNLKDLVRAVSIGSCPVLLQVTAFQIYVSP